MKEQAYYRKLFRVSGQSGIRGIKKGSTLARKEAKTPQEIQKIITRKA